MKVLLVGAGRYGNGLVGRKYAQNDYFGARIESVVDPYIDTIKNQPNYNLKSAKTYTSLDNLPKIDPQNTVAEIALTPQVIPPIFDKLVSRGIKNIIFPKPVATDFETFERLKKISEENGITALVTSNWHYSEVTKFLKAILDKAQGNEVNPEELAKYQKELDLVDSSYVIEAVNVEYSKQDEVLTIPPPSQELPHVLQILYSSGLCSLNDTEFAMEVEEQNAGRVCFKIIGSDNVKRSIQINSDLKKGAHSKSKRERIVEVELTNKKDGSKARIVADYDALFSDMKCVKSANITFEAFQNDKVLSWNRNIEEDNMDSMYQSIYRHFNNIDSGALTIEKYTPIAKMISRIQRFWTVCRVAKIPSYNFVTKPIKLSLESLKKMKFIL